MKDFKEQEIAIRIAQNIRSERLKQGIKAVDMADLLGISAPSYSQLETGNILFSVERILKVCQALQVPLHAIIEHELVPKIDEEIERLKQQAVRDKELIIDLQNRLLKESRKKKLL